MAAEFPSTIADVLAAARRHGLHLDAESARASTAGLDFFAVFARDRHGTEWVVRSPRRREVVERARHEARVLAFMQARLPVAVPEWRVHAADVIAYPKLAGVPAGEIDASIPAYVWKVDPQNLPAAFVDSTAQTLAALHAIPFAEVAAAGFAVPAMADVRDKTARQMEQVRRELGVPDPLWQRWQAWLAADELWPPAPTFVHGDFHAGHLLVDEAERLTGVLDWTEAEVGDPTVDLSIFQLLFGPDALARLLDAYAAAGGRLWPRVHEHVAETIAAYPAKIGVFALSSGQDEHLAMARNALGLS